MVAPVTGRVPDPGSFESSEDREAAKRALAYMDLEPDTPMEDVYIDKVFIGSCTNARIEDLRAAAGVIQGRKVSDGVHAMVVPGSNAVKRRAEEEGIAGIFQDAGFDWREAGCSMCLGMKRCASTRHSAAGHPPRALRDRPRVVGGPRTATSRVSKGIRLPRARADYPHYPTLRLDQFASCSCSIGQ